MSPCALCHVAVESPLAAFMIYCVLADPHILCTYPNLTATLLSHLHIFVSRVDMP